MRSRVGTSLLLLALAVTIAIHGSISTDSGSKLKAASFSPEAAHDPPTTAVQTPATATKQPDFAKLFVVVKTDSKKYSSDQLVHITILLTNRGKTPVTLSFVSTCRSSWAIQAANGTTLFAPFSAACLLTPTQLTIAPGETIEMVSFTWDLTGNQILQGGASVPEGVYIVRGYILSSPSISGFSRIRIFGPDHDHD